MEQLSLKDRMLLEAGFIPGKKPEKETEKK